MKSQKGRKCQCCWSAETFTKSLIKKRKREEENLSKHIRKNELFLIILFKLAFLNAHLYLANAQCPANSMTSFERVGGVAIKDSLLSILYTAPNSSVNMRIVAGNLERQLDHQHSSSLSNVPIPITAECNNRCRRSNKCRAFLVDYARHTCYSVEHSGSSSSIQARPIQLIGTRERTSYFEKVCLSLAASECERAWIFERVIGYHLLGYDDRIVEDVPSRLRCQELCLSEREFRCRSGEYDSFTMQCRLSSHDRHSKANAFRASAGNSDYFENQCAPVGNQCNAFDRYEDLDLGRAEIMRSANSSDQCQQFCTQTIKAFICRSFTWNPLSGKCYLNSANSFMVGGLDRLISAPGLIYFQRNECIDLKLDCDTTAMTLNLRTNEPFTGRMYVRDEPNACEVQGRAALSSSLSIPFQSQARCATREPPNRYSSVVVVQQHPMIQRKTDRYIKLVCDFQTANKTITSQYNVNSNPWTSTAVINNTSFTPQIRLRITDKFGVDITGAKLGDELYLRIEAIGDSVYDMMARSVLAKSGSIDESIVLIDKDGCPTDFRIFPTLKKLNRRTIVGKFDAFKFSSDVVVRFQVDVQFCLNECPQVTCGDTLNGSTNLLLNAQPSEALEAAATTPSSSSSSSGSSTSQPGQSDLMVAAVLSSTQAPAVSSVPFINSNNRMQQSASPPNMSAAHYPNSLYSSSTGSNPDLTQYYYSSGRHPSGPANEPASSNLNFTSSLMDSLLSQPAAASRVSDTNNQQAPDPQIFDHSLGMRPTRPQTQQPQMMLSGGDLSNSVAVKAARRRRRALTSVEQPIATTTTTTNEATQNPQPVPLQREIIVESGSSAGTARLTQALNSSPDFSRQERHRSGSQEMRKSTAREARRSNANYPKLRSDGFNRNEPTYELNGNKVEPKEELQYQQNSQQPQQDETDNGTLLCTTRHSLVIASMAFCTVQFLTIALCLFTWMHRKDSKFKVKQPTQERLY